MSTKLTLIIIFIMIAFLVIISMHRFEEFEETTKKIEIPKIEIPELKLPVLGQESELPNIKHSLPEQEFEVPKQENLEYQEFISPDNTLRLEYSSKWQRKEKDFLDIIDQKLKQEMEILFFAQRIDWEKMKFSHLIIQKLHFEKEPTIKEVIEKMKKIAKKTEIEIEIIELEKIEDNQAQLKTKYKRGIYPDIHYANTKEKILIIDDRAYWITITIRQDCPEIKKEAEKILNSAQLI